MPWRLQAAGQTKPCTLGLGMLDVLDVVDVVDVRKEPSTMPDI